MSSGIKASLFTPSRPERMKEKGINATHCKWRRVRKRQELVL
jgi:hypothetical protein